MSNEVFPTLPGIKWGTEKEPQFDTRIKRAVSGFEVRHSNRLFPTYTLKMSFEFLRSTAAHQELQAVMGLFHRHNGAGDSFLLLDPDDSTATAQAFGIGDGVTTVFNLVASWASFVQPVRHIKQVTSITVNGSATGAYTIGPTGLITFGSAPAAGAVLAWTGSYYYRCRFAADTLSPKKLWADMWELGRLELVGALGNQIG